jgi:hypothetical protein
LESDFGSPYSCNLIYLSTNSGPDIAYAVSVVAAKMAKPTERDWDMVKRLFRYLKGTQKLGIQFGADDSKIGLVGYADASYASEESRKSRTGYVHHIHLGGASIIWNSQNQRVIALSTLESEYIAAASAVQDLVWLRQFVDEINLPVVSKAINLTATIKGLFML